MRSFEFSRGTLSVGVTAALLCACGGGSSMPTATGNTTDNAGAPKGSKTFKYTGKEQTFIVPEGVTELTVIAIGGEGGGFSTYPSTATPGRPGRVYAIIPVHPGKKLHVFVGGSGTEGGFNGGGLGGGGVSYSGNVGGGASDIRAGGDTLPHRIIVAAGGGAAGEAYMDYANGYGGNGGGLVGKSGGSSSKDGSGGGGGGGTQSGGGSGGAGGGSGSPSGRSGQPGASGALGAGGSGGRGASEDYSAVGGGGGGGGYYGGGGGGGSAFFYFCYCNNQSGGGGGGSSYVEPSAIKSRMWTGWKSKGNGLVVFSWN